MRARWGSCFYAQAQWFGVFSLENDVALAQGSPMGAKGHPKGAQGHPKGAKEAQRDPKGHPKGAQGHPKGAKASPKSTQRKPKAPQRHPNEAKGTTSIFTNSRSTAQAAVMLALTATISNGARHGVRRFWEVALKAQREPKGTPKERKKR